MSKIDTDVTIYPERIIKEAHTGNFPVQSICIDWEIVKEGEKVIAILPKVKIEYDTD